MITINPSALIQCCADAYVFAEEDLNEAFDYGRCWSILRRRLCDPAGLLRRGRPADVTFFGGQFERGHGEDDGDGGGAHGRVHLQGYIHLARPVRRSYCQAVFPGSHLEAAHAGATECWNYCSKQDTRVAGPFSHGEIGRCGQGARSDIVEAVKAVEAGVEPHVWVSEHPEALRYAHHLRAHAAACATPRSADSPPTVYWCWGPTGSGKTRWAAEATQEGSTYWKPPGSKWWDGYTGQDAVIIDDYRPSEHIPFNVLLRLLDRYPFKAEIKGSYREFNSPVIIITTPHDPDTTYTAECAENLQQLHRRITHTKRFPLDCSVIIVRHAMLAPHPRLG